MNLDALTVGLCHMDQQVNVLFTLNMQLDVIHVQEVADDTSTLELVSVFSLCDYLTEWVQTYAEQKWVECITLLYAIPDSQLGDLY